jgi:hypothetical protein
MVGTVAQAAGWVDEVGLALLFPKADVVLPSLWEQVNGSRAENWSIREPDGSFVRWTDEMAFLWGAKDELPAQGLVCVGKHVAKVASCVSRSFLPTVVAAGGGDEPEGVELAVVELIRDEGPLTAPQLRRLTRLPKKEIDKAVARLHHRLVLTNSHLVEQSGPWGALAHDLLARKWGLPVHLAGRDEARRELARHVLKQAGELTAADLGGALGWRRKEAATVLEEIGEGRDEAGFRIWTRR